MRLMSSKGAGSGNTARGLLLGPARSRLGQGRPLIDGGLGRFQHMRAARANAARPQALPLLE